MSKKSDKFEAKLLIHGFRAAVRNYAEKRKLYEEALETKKNAQEALSRAEGICLSRGRESQMANTAMYEALGACSDEQLSQALGLDA